MLFSSPSIALAVVVASISPSVLEAANLRHRSLQTYTASDDYFSLMLDRVNQARSAAGLPALCMNKKLQAAAQEHSDDQAAHNYMDHTGSDGSTISDRISGVGYNWSSIAENVAAGQVDVDSVMDSWMNSPGHRANILGDYTMFGTAYAYNADSTFKHYWTQDFGSGDAEQCDGSSTTNNAPEIMKTTTIKSETASAYQDTEVPANEAEEPTMQTLDDSAVVIVGRSYSGADEPTTPLKTYAPTSKDTTDVKTPCPTADEPTVVINTATTATPCPSTTTPATYEPATEVETPCPSTTAPTTDGPIGVVHPPVTGSYKQETPYKTYGATEEPVVEYGTKQSKKDCKSSL